MHHRLLLLGLALTIGCGSSQPPNLLLIVVDTLRVEQVNRKVLEWIDSLAGAKPVFLYIQYMEPHTPYYPSALALERLEEALDEKARPNLRALGYVE